jgi:hypothetical protein
MNRRNFIETSVRVLLISGLAALSGFAVYKMLQPDTCTENPQCKGCGKYKSCSLPQKQKVD